MFFHDKGHVTQLKSEFLHNFHHFEDKLCHSQLTKSHPSTSHHVNPHTQSKKHEKKLQPWKKLEYFTKELNTFS